MLWVYNNFVCFWIITILCVLRVYQSDIDNKYYLLLGNYVHCYFLFENYTIMIAGKKSIIKSQQCGTDKYINYNITFHRLTAKELITYLVCIEWIKLKF